MRSNEIKMAYYGILMKDGTELTHYGVKGMKWGKHKFGKKKTLFGTPGRSSGMMTWQNASSNPGSDGRTEVYKKKMEGQHHNFGDDEHFRTHGYSPERAESSPGARSIRERQENNDWIGTGRTSRTFGVQTMGQVKRKKKDRRSQ